MSIRPSERSQNLIEAIKSVSNSPGRIETISQTVESALKKASIPGLIELSEAEIKCRFQFMIFRRVYAKILKLSDQQKRKDSLYFLAKHLFARYEIEAGPVFAERVMEPADQEYFIRSLFAFGSQNPSQVSDPPVPTLAELPIRNSSTSTPTLSLTSWLSESTEDEMSSSCE